MECFSETLSRVVFACMLAVSGCATGSRPIDTTESSEAAIPAAWTVAPYATPSDDELLRYIEDIRAMPSEQLEREAAEVDQHARVQPNPTNRLRLGMFLGFAPAPFRATTRAQELLDGVWRDDDRQREIVRLLLAVLEDRHELEMTLSDERRQRQALRSKLDQLKAIEEDIDRRMQPPIINPR